MMVRAAATLFLVSLTIAAGARAAGVVPATHDIELRVAVRASGKRADQAYVALVPSWRPWARPIAESTTQTGVVTFHVSPDVYRIVTATPDGNALTGHPLFFGEDREVAVDLPPMTRRSGFVRDRGGVGVAGATVAEVNAAIEAPYGRLSQLAKDYYGKHWQTTTAADGSWSLSLPAEAKTPLVAEASGFATGWHAYVPGSDANIAFVMQSGEELQLQSDRADPGVALTLTQTHPSGAIPAGWQAQYWARSVRSTSTRWPGLPPGEYEIYAQPADPQSLGLATLIKTVTLGGGVTKTAVTLPPARPASVSHPLYLEGAEQQQLDGLHLFATNSRGEPVAAPYALEDTTGGVVAHVGVAQMTTPLFGVTADSWVAALDSTAGDATEPARAMMADLARAGMHMRSGDPAIPVPHTGTISFRGCEAASVVDMPVTAGKDGTVLFDAPAGCSGIVVKFPSFGPLSLSRSLAAQKTTWLGEFTLFPGGRAAVHVTDDAGQPLPDAMVSIYSAGERANASPLTLAEQTTGPSGWAYVDGLPSRRELMVVARTVSHEESAPLQLRVSPGAETVIDPVRVQRPATLIIHAQLDPEFRERFPAAVVDSLVLAPDDPSLQSEQQRQHVAEGGTVTFHGLRPGRWHTTAILSTGKGFQPLAGDDVQLASGATVRLDRTFAPLVFTGHVSLRGAAVQGNVDIRGTQFTDIVPSISTDRNGYFQAILPRRDTYLVDVRTLEPMQIMWVGGVRFTEPSQPVDIALPVGAVHVQVARGDSPATRVLVSARQQLDTALGVEPIETIPAETDPDGISILDALLPGTWIITAQDPERGEYASKTVNVGSDVAHVVIHLEKSAALQGTVRDATGVPVAGAAVRCVVGSPAGIAQLITTTSADDGTFRFESSRDEGAARCSVLSAAGVQAYRLNPGTDADLVLPGDAGGLTVSPLPAVSRLTSFWLAASDGRLLDVTPFIRRSDKTAALKILALAPDDWRLVKVDSLQDWIALTAGRGTVLPLTEFTVHPGKEIRVDLQ